VCIWAVTGLLKSGNVDSCKGGMEGQCGVVVIAYGCE
jgi:hypothetical protein